ncbi:MAG: A/G-specific adenine glycosylase [Bacteroidetes bacterium]|nr:A/G-specific adenine glycosylase [Bacteroidota bacterium]
MGIKDRLKKEFSQVLLTWNKEQNIRQMPWKGEKDPYKIWLSEVILQQTRVEQGLSYYNSFTRAFPNIQKLAKANDERVFKLWEGLGYYSRCRNLLFTARHISEVMNGKFPSTYEEIKSLKGVGPYTAAAIASFAYNLPHAVVDGNVFRVLARVFGISKPIDSNEGKILFTHLADELLDKVNPGLYNQAIMDFGAIVCKPVAPLCDTCIFKKKCEAYLNKKIHVLPVKEKKIKAKGRYFYYLLLEYKDKTAVLLRTAKDIWQGLYEFPLLEAKQEESIKKIISRAEKEKWLQKGSYEILSVSSVQQQRLSHQIIAGQFIRIQLKRKPLINRKILWVTKQQISKLAFPKFINQYLQTK